MSARSRVQGADSQGMATIVDRILRLTNEGIKSKVFTVLESGSNDLNIEGYMSHFDGTNKGIKLVLGAVIDQFGAQMSDTVESKIGPNTSFSNYLNRMKGEEIFPSILASLVKDMVLVSQKRLSDQEAYFNAFPPPDHDQQCLPGVAQRSQSVIEHLFASNGIDRMIQQAHKYAVMQCIEMVKLYCDPSLHVHLEGSIEGELSLRSVEDLSKRDVFWSLPLASIPKDKKFLINKEYHKLFKSKLSSLFEEFSPDKFLQNNSSFTARQVINSDLVADTQKAGLNVSGADIHLFDEKGVFVLQNLVIADDGSNFYDEECSDEMTIYAAQIFFNELSKLYDFTLQDVNLLIEEGKAITLKDFESAIVIKLEREFPDDLIIPSQAEPVEFPVDNYLSQEGFGLLKRLIESPYGHEKRMSLDLIKVYSSVESGQICVGSNAIIIEIKKLLGLKAVLPFESQDAVIMSKLNHLRAGQEEFNGPYSNRMLDAMLAGLIRYENRNNSFFQSAIQNHLELMVHGNSDVVTSFLGLDFVTPLSEESLSKLFFRPDYKRVILPKLIELVKSDNEAVAIKAVTTMISHIKYSIAYNDGDVYQSLRDQLFDIIIDEGLQRLFIDILCDKKIMMPEMISINPNSKDYIEDFLSYMFTTRKIYTIPRDTSRIFTDGHLRELLFHVVELDDVATFHFTLRVMENYLKVSREDSLQVLRSKNARGHSLLFVNVANSNDPRVAKILMENYNSRSFFEEIDAAYTLYIISQFNGNEQEAYKCLRVIKMIVDSYDLTEGMEYGNKKATMKEKGHFIPYFLMINGEGGDIEDAFCEIVNVMAQAGRWEAISELVSSLSEMESLFDHRIIRKSIKEAKVNDSEDEYSLLDFAIKLQHEELLEALLSSDAYNKEEINGLLSYLVNSGLNSFAGIAISYGGDLDTTNENGASILEIALIENEMDLLRSFLRRLSQEGNPEMLNAIFLEQSMNNGHENAFSLLAKICKDDKSIFNEQLLIIFDELPAIRESHEIIRQIYRVSIESGLLAELLGNDRIIEHLLNSAEVYNPLVAAVTGENFDQMEVYVDNLRDEVFKEFLIKGHSQVDIIKMTLAGNHELGIRTTLKALNACNNPDERNSVVTSALEQMMTENDAEQVKVFISKLGDESLSIAGNFIDRYIVQTVRNDSFDIAEVSKYTEILRKIDRQGYRQTLEMVSRMDTQRKGGKRGSRPLSQTQITDFFKPKRHKDREAGDRS